MDEQIRIVQLVKRALEAVHQTVWQVSDETNCVEHVPELAVGKSQLPLRGVQSLEEAICRLQPAPSHAVD